MCLSLYHTCEIWTVGTHLYFDLVFADKNSSNSKTFEISFYEFFISEGVIGEKKAVEPLFVKVTICHEFGDNKQVVSSLSLDY